jgi:mRNA interferase RelE/StbE
MPKKFKVLYSETSKNQITKLHPSLKPLIKSKIEKLMTEPYIGKSLERELSGYLSFRAKRYRIIYKIEEKKRRIEIHYVGHRKDIYELFGDQLREIRSHNS